MVKKEISLDDWNKLVKLARAAYAGPSDGNPEARVLAARIIDLEAEGRPLADDSIEGFRSI